MKNRSWFLLVILALLSWSACLKIDNTFTKIPPGPWRAVLQLDPSAITPNPKGEPLDEKLNLTFDEVTNGELPFNFEVTYTDDTTFYLELLNGSERIKLDQITFGRTRARVKDSIRIEFPVYDSYITGFYEEDLIDGYWVVNYRDNYRIPFRAQFGEAHRFTTLKKEPVTDLTGRWEVTFGPGGDEDEAFPAIGEFVQKGNHLEGTFRTETGDYRYLEGTVQGNKAYLSTFDGAHAFLFEALIMEDETLVGSFRSGTHYRTVWQAQRNSEATLTDPNELTYLKEGYDRFDFSFPDTDGNTISLSDPAYDGKVKLVQILGTWCPNCRDETNFLLDYLADNSDPDLAVIGLAYEQYQDEEKARSAISRMRESMQVPYPILHAGYHDKQAASETLPMLNRILSYPTLLFIDRENKVRRIHTGFNGPATDEYAAFKEDFEQTITSLLQENQAAN